MRRPALAALGAILILLLILLFRRHRESGAPSPASSPPPMSARRTSPSATAPATADKSRRVDARRMLAKSLTSRVRAKTLSDAAVPHASVYRWLLFIDPDFRTLLQELQSELGEEFGDALRSLYGELESPAYRSLIVLLLGASRAQGSVEFLKSAVQTGDHRVACAAAYAMGLLGDDDARGFLVGRYRTLRHDPNDYPQGQLKEVVEAALAASGEKAIPFLIEQARIQHAADDAEEGPPAADARYYVAEHLLASLRIDRLSPELKKLFLTETDPRIRSSLLVGLARNGIPEVYGFLAEVAESEPKHRKDVIQAVGRILSNEVLGPVPGPLADSLRRIFLSEAPENLKEYSDFESWIVLASRLGGAQELERLRSVFALDLDKVYGEMAGQVRDSIAYCLGRSKSRGALEDFLKGQPATVDRAQLLAASLRHEESGAQLEANDVRTLLDGIRTSPPDSLEVCYLLWPLARASGESEAVVAALEGVYAREPAQVRETALETASKLGAPAIPFLESVMKGDGDTLFRFSAARKLVSLASEEDLRGRLAPEFSDLLMPGKPIPAEVFKGSGRRTWSYGDLVRDYYGRLGTREDLKLLDSIPDRLSFSAGVDEDDARTFRSYLREQCRQAKDAILLRTPTAP